MFKTYNSSEIVKLSLERIETENIVKRIWKKDFTVWNEDPTEISNRLGWLDSPDETKKNIQEISAFVDELISEGFTNALLMGMGGSSLAPEVFSKTFGAKEGYLNIFVLDSTDPLAVKRFCDDLNPEKTIYIVSTKSGGTVETMSFMKFFFNYVSSKIGEEKVSKHFMAITDPGSGLEETARSLNFRKIFLNDPNIGGRFSALSLFGCVPAALLGIDLNKFIERTEKIAIESKIEKVDADSNSSAYLGCWMGELAEKGIDKISYILSGQISSIGSWLEQLIAESTGKNGKGILPVDGEKITSIEKLSKDRAFVFISLENEKTNELLIEKLDKAGFPIIEIVWKDVYDLGAEFFRWEFATAVAGWVMKVQPFDQPNVESAKIIASQFVKKHMEEGVLPEVQPSLTENNIKVYSNIQSETISDIIKSFLNKAISGKNYLSIHAYLTPSIELDQKLEKFRIIIEENYNIPVTVGYGPRFLHSTGQLHKGDAGNGLFIQLLDEPELDLNIPDNPGNPKSSITFGVLKSAQALGDRQALIDNNRSVISFNLGKHIHPAIDHLAKSI